MKGFPAGIRLSYDHALGSRGSDPRQRAGTVDHLIGILLIIFVAPLVGLIGTWIEGAGHRALGKSISIGGVLLVLGIAGWLIVRSF